MDTTFISIHDLSDKAITLYTSDSVVDVLGWTPEQLVGHSAWSLFHPDELPLARWVHGKKVSADKAAVLAYCRIRDKDDNWVGCECCFSIVYDVMIACTSIYQRGSSSEQRAREAPMVRRTFSSSPLDPRYHMLSHISTKFTRPLSEEPHEPRAALFLNRFTRTLTIMYATNGLKDVVGIPAEEMRGRSFYYCIAESCLPDSMRCLENAKANNSIAYLRFWFRDPRTDDEPPVGDEASDDGDEEMTEVSEDFDAEDRDDDAVQIKREPSSPPPNDLSRVERSTARVEVDDGGALKRRRNSSGESSRAYETHEAIFGSALVEESSASSIAQSPVSERRRSVSAEPIELEAVISCASDGLVVCLRHARTAIPALTAKQPTSRKRQRTGVFAAPWAVEPILPPLDIGVAAAATPSSSSSVSSLSTPQRLGTTFAPALGPQAAQHPYPKGGPAQHDFMKAIREQAVFAWALTGINGGLYAHKVGRPSGESLPQAGLPIWTKDGHAMEKISEAERAAAAAAGDGSGEAAGGSSQETVRPPTGSSEASSPAASSNVSRTRAGLSPQFFGDPGLERKFQNQSQNQKPGGNGGNGGRPSGAGN